MRALTMMTWTELKLFLREPAAFFFTLAFPVMLLLIFGSIFGNEPDPELGGRGSVDVSVPGYAAQVIGTVTLIGLPVTLGAYREYGILRRLRATPISPFVVVGARLLVDGFFTMVGVGLVVVVGRVLYGLALPAAPVAIVAALLLATLCFSAVGFVLAGLLPTARTAQAVGSAIFFPQLFLSGAAIPREIMTGTVREIADRLPLTQVVILVGDLWLGGAWNWTATAVLVGLLAVGTLLAARTFRWE